MAFTPADVEALIIKVRELSAGLREAPPKIVEAIVGKAVSETTETVKAIEQRIVEAGCMPGDLIAVLLHYGAINRIVRDLPPGDHRRELIEAGDEIGAAIAVQFGQRIEEQLKGKGN
jgi:hypothetical protein